MTFIDWATRVSTRFLSDRAFELIVAPALADYEFEHDGTGRLTLARGRVAVLSALAGAVCDDIRHGVSALTLATLTLIPACYFGFMFALCTPRGVRVFSSTDTVVAVAVMILVLSPVPVIACCWPERQTRRPASEVP